MKQILVKRISEEKKAVYVIINGITKGYRTMDFKDVRKMLAAINMFQRKFGMTDKDIVYSF
jgi:hypothetical protein|nr:MAG TPA: hypothetical protein [Caudoviricetes sp.]